MGPFQWQVWLSILLAYTLAILPISYSAHHTLRPLLDDPSELENMFWYVFGTFTNCFTFSGNQSWTRCKMISTRVFIGKSGDSTNIVCTLMESINLLKGWNNSMTQETHNNTKYKHCFWQDNKLLLINSCLKNKDGIVNYYSITSKAQ